MKKNTFIFSFFGLGLLLTLSSCNSGNPASERISRHDTIINEKLCGLCAFA